MKVVLSLTGGLLCCLTCGRWSSWFWVLDFVWNITLCGVPIVSVCVSLVSVLCVFVHRVVLLVYVGLDHL